MREAQISVQQGHNIKLLTLVSCPGLGHTCVKVLTSCAKVTIFFLPLTFVTSGVPLITGTYRFNLADILRVFGMTNMSPNNSFRLFGIVTLTICLPTYLIIGFVNTGTGPKMWSQVTGRLAAQSLKGLAKFLTLFGFNPRWTKSYVQISGPEPGRNSPRLTWSDCCAGYGLTGWSLNS